MIGKLLKTKPLAGKNATKDEVLKRISSVALAHIATHCRKETGEILFAPNLGMADENVKEEDCILKMPDLEAVWSESVVVVKRSRLRV